MGRLDLPVEGDTARVSDALERRNRAFGPAGMEHLEPYLR